MRKVMVVAGIVLGLLFSNPDPSAAQDIKYGICEVPAANIDATWGCGVAQWDGPFMVKVAIQDTVENGMCVSIHVQLFNDDTWYVTDKFDCGNNPQAFTVDSRHKQIGIQSIRLVQDNGFYTTLG